MDRKNVLRAVALLYGGFILYIILRSDSGGCGTVCAPAKWFPMGDKVGHVVLLSFLTLISNLAFESPRQRFGFSIVSACVLIAISLEECSQVIFPGRTPDVLDQLANCVGILCGDLFSRLLRPRIFSETVVFETSLHYPRHGS